MQNPRSSIVDRLVGVIASIIAVALTAPVIAQGAGGVSDPMSLRSVMDLFSRYTDLEPNQRVAFESVHDRYLEGFERLREGEIQEFTDLAQQTEGGRSGQMPSLDQMEEFFAKWGTVNRRVAALDRRFFEEIQPILNEGQADALVRVGLVRGRERNLGSNRMLSRGLGAGIDMAFWRIEPTEAERLAVDDVLRGYEAVMVRLVEDHSKASVGMVRDILRNMSDAGYSSLNREDMQDPQVVQEVMAVMAEAQRLAMQPMYEAQTAIEDRGLSSARGFRSRLTPERWYRMKRIWISSAFPGTGLGLTGGNELDVPRHADEVRAVIDDDEDRSAALEMILRDWFATEDRNTDELIEFAREQSAREFLQPMAMGNLGPTSIREVHVQRREAAERAIRSLLDLVPDPVDRVAIEKRIATGASMIVQGGVEIPIKARKAADPEAEEDRARVSLVRGMANIPVPISRADLELVAWMLALDADEKTIVETLHVDYLQNWTASIDPIVKQAKRSRTVDANGVPNEGLVEARRAILQTALESILELDETFLEQVASSVGGGGRSAGIEGVRIQRIFDRIESIAGSRFDGMFGLPIIEPTSPYRLLQELELDPETSRRGLALLLERNPDLRSAVEGWELARLEADHAANLASARWAMEPTLPAGATAADYEAAAMASFQLYYDSMAESMNRRRTKARSRRTIVASAVEETVLPELPPLSGLELKVAMFDRGWSGVRDSGTGLATAREVLRMPGLDEDQSTVIETLLLDHLEKENALIIAMADENTSLANDEANMDMTRSTQISEKFNFRRGELQERLLQRFLVILTPDQIARIPALAERAG